MTTVSTPERVVGAAASPTPELVLNPDIRLDVNVEPDVRGFTVRRLASGSLEGVDAGLEASPYASGPCGGWQLDR